MRRCKPPPNAEASERDPGLSLAASPKALSRSNEHPQNYPFPLRSSKPVSLRVGFIGRGYTRVRFSSPIFAHPERTNASQRQPRGIQDLTGYEPAKGD